MKQIKLVFGLLLLVVGSIGTVQLISSARHPQLYSASFDYITAAFSALIALFGLAIVARSIQSLTKK